MSEYPTAVAREAKKTHQSLKELLKTKEPFDRDVEFLRKSLRKSYLSLLLVYPTSNDSKDVENHLWMQTSYAFISSYKQRISADRDIQNNQRQQQLQQDHGQSNKQSNTYHRVVEHRRLIQRFKQFLADEEKFWAQLVLRLLRLFDLQEARPALATLGLLSELDEAVASNSDGAAVTQIVTLGSNGRNHFQFPPEDSSVIDHPATDEERETRLSTLSKALICLGDIARYREQYNESNGRPRAGQDDAIPARRGRSKRGGGPEVVARPRNYDKALQIYEQARSLVPNEGNPSHQLAILASYQNDSFSSIVHYYRSLCVRQPYDTAAENLGTVLAKALDAWRQKMKREKEKNGTNDMALAPRVRIDLFKERLVVLHALWRTTMEKGTEKMKSIAPKHGEKVADDFYSLVSERHLPIEVILNTIVLSQGALWKHRMIRDSPASHLRKSQSSSVPEGTATLIEWAILDHLLDLHLVLLEVGKEELKEPPSTDDLAQRITAIFRRTLPALRIASKWLRANFKYLGQDPEFVAFQEKQKSKGLTTYKIDPKKISRYSTKSVKFWKAYAAFMLALSQAFPLQKLPPFEASLEEDIEMRGFLPLRKLVGEEKNAEGKKISNGKEPAREQVHPNVEQLMRITDLLDDAKFLVQMENSPLSFINNHIVFNRDVVENTLPLTTEKSHQTDTEPSASHQLLADPNTDLILHPKFDRDEDNMTDVTSRTEDDPVRDAFLHLDTPDEQDDEVVYMRSPTLSPTFHAPTTPVKTLRSPSNLSPRSPVLQQPNTISTLNFPVPSAPQASSTITAQDLLNDIGGFNNSLRNVESSAPQPKFLFGSELTHRPSQSIWSAAHDEQPLMYGGNVHSGLTNLGGNQISVMNGITHNVGVPSHSDGLQPGDNALAGTVPGQIYQTSVHPFSAVPGSQDQSLSHWAYGGQTVDQPSGSFSHLQPHRHGRESLGALHPVQPYNSHIVQIQSDPFAFTSQQPPIQRPDPQTSTMPSHRGSSFIYSGSFPSGSQPIYASISPEYHSTQPLMHASQIATEQSYMSPTATQTWGHGG